MDTPIGVLECKEEGKATLIEIIEYYSYEINKITLIEYLIDISTLLL